LRIKVKPYQLLTWDARRTRKLIDLALQRGAVDPTGIKFSVSRRWSVPTSQGGVARIPSGLIPDEIDNDPLPFMDCVAHEARHMEIARDPRYDSYSQEQHHADAVQASRRAMTGGWPSKMVVPHRRANCPRLSR
jgi:hypothetical protein